MRLKLDQKLKLLGCNELPYDGKVFIIEDDRRRWSPDATRLTQQGYLWPDDVTYVTSEAIANYVPGPPVPQLWTKSDLKHPPKGTSLEQMREIIFSQLHGVGIEFGASAHPAAIPLGCRIRYADIESAAKLEDFLIREDSVSPNIECMPTEIVSSFETMENISDDSQDFIIASHVIEHVRNPLKAMESAWNKLRPGGTLALVIPHRDKTLDAKRPLTNIEHLWLDFSQPSKDRDLLNLMEFFTLAKPPASMEQLYASLMQCYSRDHPYIHYHVWDENSFKATIKLFNKKIKQWKQAKVIPCLPDGYEFYCLLEK